MDACTWRCARQEQQQELASGQEQALPILLEQPAFHQHDARLGCALLDVSKGVAAEARRLLAGQLDADVRLWSPEDAEQLGAWLRGPNAPLLRSLTVRLLGQGPSPVELAAGVVGAAAAAVAAAAAPTSGLRLSSLRVLNFCGGASRLEPELAVQLAQALPAGLTALQMDLHEAGQQLDSQCAAALARLSALRSLQLGELELQGPVLGAVASLQGLTALAAEAISSEGCARLPASLVELEVCRLTAGSGHQPAELSRLTGLTDLAVFFSGLPAGSSLPPSLRRLALDNLSGVEHLLPAQLLQLTSLRLFDATFVPAAWLLALTQLERLAQVSLGYMGKVPSESPQAWAALPLVGLELLHVGPPASEVVGLSRLTRLTSLRLLGARDGFAGPQGAQRLAQLLPSLTGLQELLVAYCSWDEGTDLTALASAVALLPSLRELGWYHNKPALTEAAGLLLAAARGLTSLQLSDRLPQRVLLALTRLTGLKQLECDMQAVAEPDGVLAAWAQRLTGLECLALSGPPATVACLSALSRLTHLHLGDIALATEAEAVLRRCRAARCPGSSSG